MTLTAPTTAQRFLRDATHVDHERVDALYSRFDLADRASYAAFVQAQARALFALEAALIAFPALPAWRARSPLIAQDLADLGLPLPHPAPVGPLHDDAAACGTLYVLEGSRLGGSILAKRVGTDFPAAFITASHQPAEWRALLGAIAQAADRGGAIWRTSAIGGAKSAFDVYADAAIMR